MLKNILKTDNNKMICNNNNRINKIVKKYFKFEKLKNKKLNIY